MTVSPGKWNAVAVSGQTVREIADQLGHANPAMTQSIAVLLALLIVDFAITRRPHEVRVREALGWSMFYLALPMVFTLFLWATNAFALLGCAPCTSCCTPRWPSSPTSTTGWRSSSASSVSNWCCRLQRGRSVIHLLCTQETRDHANSYVQACWRAKSSDKEHHDKTIVALQAFTTSLRKEIGA
uniref:hypothetical protein n=1 Tax=Saccharopolyspora elongata TaxID=2530387 RepID=UPI001F41E33B|nr:hypothetical protein [Saccharopolyspora elongata]